MMPKIKKTKKKQKPRKSRYKVDIQKIIKEREAQGLLMYQLQNKAKTPEENIVENKLLPSNESNDPVTILDTIDLLQDSSLTLLSLAIPDLSEYKKSLEITSFPSNKTELCTKKVFETSIMNENGYTEMIHSNNLIKGNWCLNRLLLMSIEENELAANIQFNYLIKANWSPTLNDIKKCLSNWSVDLDILTNNKKLLKLETICEKQIRQHNFELVINLISYYVRKAYDEFSTSDLLTLAKLCAALFVDHQCRKMIHVIRQIFSDCIEKALNENDETAIISFFNDLYSTYWDKDLLYLSKIIIDLYLPIQSNSMKKLYAYSTYKLFKTLLDVTNNTILFPSKCTDWFLLKSLNSSLFVGKSKKTIKTTIKLLEHVVMEFDLYQDEDNLSEMCWVFKHNLRLSLPFFDTIKSNDILDRVKMNLFRIHLSRYSENSLYINTILSK